MCKLRPYPLYEVYSPATLVHHPPASPVDNNDANNNNPNDSLIAHRAGCYAHKSTTGSGGGILEQRIRCLAQP